MNNILKLLNNAIDTHGVKNYRDGKFVNEIIGYNINISINKIDLIDEQHEEYIFYKEIFNSYKDIFNKNIDDIYSRRLMIQSPLDFHYKENKEMMPCPESFAIFYIDDNNYIITINFRSSDITRFETDLRIIYTYCIKELDLKGCLQKINVNFFNLHKYII